jgi:LytR cell envelope-related transcriptional attenuator
MEVIKEVGAFAGLAAFFGLAVLALLYFAQARDVRRLRENAEFLVEGDEVSPHEPVARGEVDEPVPASVAQEEPETAARTAAATAPNDAEAFRRAELARQAAERRQRFEERRRGEGGGMGNLFGEGRSSTAVIVVGALILLAGIGFGATRLLGGDDGTSVGTDGSKGGNACPPGQTKVAVLNGTAEPGLAAGFAQQLKTASYDVGPVSNTESAFDTSVVMYDPKSGQACAPEVAGIVAIPTTEAITGEIRGVSEGAAVAVVLGEDQASGSTSSTESSTDSSSTGASSSGTLVD